MSASDEYKELKTLFYESSYSVKRVEVKFSNVDEPEQWAKVVFENGGGTKEITGTSDDYISAASSLNSIIENGEEKFVDLSDTAVGGTDGYYQNVKHFVAKNQSSVEKGLEELQSNNQDEQIEADLDEALRASINNEMDNKELLKVVKNYHKAVALEWLILRDYKEAMESFKKSVPHNHNLFDDIQKDAFAILRDEYVNTNPKKGYTKFIETTISDPEFLMERLANIRNKTSEEWSALAGDSGKIQTRIAMQRVLDEYAKQFEIARDLLRDLAATLDRENQFENVDLTSWNSVKEFLEDSGYSVFTNCIIEDFRHGPSHMSLEVDDEEGEVRIFNNRGRHRKLENTVEFQELVKKQKQIRDIVSALLISFMSCLEILRYLYLSSNDFRFHVIVNTDPELLE
jgi:tetratricopeptide (TPR) repeat protein